MSNRTAGIVGATVLAIFLAAFTSSALAGNGNGKDNGNSQAAPAAQPAPDATPSPGNSGNAPGHNKDATQAAAQSTPSSGHGNKHSGANGSASQNSPSTPGMKPANNTSKHTTCVTGGGGGSGVTCAPTSANTAAVGHKDASKRYGNGKTAAQIATQNGASAGTTLYGPGNSQPHKVQVCGKANGHWVDVHAVKNYSGAKCSTSSPTQKVTPGRSTIVSSAIGAVGATPASGSTAAGTSTQVAGGVLGVTATSRGAGHGNGSFGGVLGALTSVGQGVLPFTGFPLWIVVVLALALIGVGVTFRRTSRARI